MAKNEFNIDANINNADWAKRTWDILPPTMDRLLEVLRVTNKSTVEKQRAVADFMKLPAARAMPAELRAELKKLGLL